MNKEKPPMLSDEQMSAVKFDMGSPWGLVDRYTVGKAVAQAQLDVCVAHYEPIVQQAKENVAEDIGSLACCLIGNLMLEDMEAGDLLGSQLEPLINTIKLRYLPHLPRKELVK